MDITTKRYLFSILVFIQWINYIVCCNKGLTQLRYPKSLELMYCIPNSRNEPDPCKLLTGGFDAFCQRDFKHEFICCGTIDLFIDLLSNGYKRNSEPLSTIQLDYSEPRYTRKEVDLHLNSVHIDYDEEINWSPLQLLPTSTTILPIVFPNKEKISDRVNSRITKKPFTRRPITYRTFSISPVTQTTRQRIPSSTFSPVVLIKESLKYIMENGPLISLISSGYFNPSNTSSSVSWSAPATVTLIQDGHCSIIVNSGLPIQKNDLVTSLTAKSLFGQLFNYTVITSGHPQFIGNINLFESRQLIVGLLGIRKNIVTSNKLDIPMSLCSSNTQIIHTPGPTPDSVSVIAKNVPGMGTVAITGSLFIQDDSLNRIDFPFAWNQELLFDSRKKIICLSDWLVPGHSVPIPVTRQLKIVAGCPHR